LNIIAVLNPLYQDLLAIKYDGIISDANFNRITNSLGITDIYAEAVNESRKDKENDQYAWLSFIDNSNEDILGHFLNKLFQKPPAEFQEKLTALLADTLPILNYVPGVTDIVSDLSSIGVEKSFLDKITVAWQKNEHNYVKKVAYFQSLVMTRGINRPVNEAHYAPLRADILNHHALKDHVPDYIVNNPQIQGFWEFIKGQGGYRIREAFMADTFEPLVKASQNILNVAHDTIFTKPYQNIDMAFIGHDWKKALNRLKDDPEAAITSARSLTETVCKYILDASQVEFDDSIDLIKLYTLTARQLNLSPETHTEPIFKQILSGCFSIVSGLSGLRNKHSDAHGKKTTNIKPSSRHAKLAVNIAGATCSFLLQTFEFRQESIISNTKP